MSRLIEDDALIKILKRTSVFECVRNAADKNVFEIIADQPTAYNVDAVVAEIKKKHCQKCRNILGVPGAEEYCKEQKCEIEAVCEIVRKGGVE